MMLRRWSTSEGDFSLTSQRMPPFRTQLDATIMMESKPLSMMIFPDDGKELISLLEYTLQTKYRHAKVALVLFCKHT